MTDPIVELKVRAELLHKAVAANDSHALERLRALPEHRKADAAALAALVEGVRHKHCLAVVAREVGFTGWDHAVRVIEGDPAEADFGDLLSSPGRGAFLNQWLATYDEAKAIHRELCVSGAGSYLLAFRRHFFLTERGYVESLGLDPDDADWAAMGWDWARPASVDARRRLYGRLVTRQPPQGAARS